MPGDGQIGRGQRLGDGDDVGLQPVGLAAEHVARAPETADDLVGDEQDVVLLQDRLDLVEICGRRQQHAARAHDRLGDEGRDRLRPFLLDQRLQARGHAAGELLLALAGLAEAVVVGAVGMDDVGDRQVEILVDRRQPGHRSGRHRDAVIAADPADDLLLLRPAQRIVHVPHHLDDGVVGLRARVAEEGLGHRHRRHGHQFLGQVDRHFGHLLGEGMVVGQLLHLARRRLDQPLLAVAQRQAPEPREPLKIALALVVIDIDALAAGQHQRTLGLVLAGVGVGMEVKGDVAGGRRIAAERHGNLEVRAARGRLSAW